MNSKIKTLALLLIIPFVLTACTLQETLQKLPIIGERFGANAGPVTMNAWGLWENADVINELISNYTQANPDVTIVYEDRSVMDPLEYKERIYTRFQEESTDIDFALVHNSWVPSLVPFLEPAPASLINAQTYEQKYYPSAIASGVFNGQVYAIPAYYDGLVLVYNKSHFDEIGQSTPPTAWEEFRRLALELTIRTDDGAGLLRGGAAIGTADNVTHFSDILGLMWSQAGVEIPSEIATVPAADALTYYTNFVREDGVWSSNMPKDTEAFVQGRASMVFVPSWQLLDIIENIPNIDDVGVAPVPQALLESPASWGSFWMYVVPKNTAKSAAAWQYLTYLSQEETELFYFNQASQVRLFGAPFANKNLATDMNNPFLRPILSTAPYSFSAEITARSGNRRQVDALRNAVNAVLSNRGTSSNSESALTTALSEIGQ